MIQISKFNRRSLLALTLAGSIGMATGIAPFAAQAAPDINKIHFLIPGGAGGGWDGTARGTGEALTRAAASSGNCAMRRILTSSIRLTGFEVISAENC